MQQVIYCIVLILLAWIAVSDSTKKTIPPVSVWLLFLAGAAQIIFLDGSFFVSAISGLLIIGVPMLLLACVLNRNDIGGGDVKLCAVLGFLLGPVYALIVLMSALLFLVVYSMFAKKDVGYPFAPFVLIGYVLTLIFLIPLGG
ncbi:MAG: prepilin peptidase [Oscillospiraceae bacterium]